VTPALVGVLALAVWLALSPTRGPSRRLRIRLAPPPRGAARGYADSRPEPGAGAGPAPGRETAPRRGTLGLPALRRLHPLIWTQPGPTFVPMALLVQQSAALLRGGRAPALLWDELWLLYGVEPPPGRSTSDAPHATLAPASRASLAAARAAARCGAPVGEAIRRAATVRVARAAPGSRADDRERGAWIEFAVCFDVAEASGCPLADVLTRFAAQLEAEVDAEAARQTALAGPRATVRLLGWLPVLGLGLGMMLGVDPINILLGEPAGLAALAAGVALTAAGRIWSARLVRSAAGHTK
jgi:tight adherence protein B